MAHSLENSLIIFLVGDSEGNRFPNRPSYESILILLVCCIILYEGRSGDGRAYRKGVFLFTIGDGKAGAAYVHSDQGLS